MKTAKLAFRPTLLLGVMAGLGLATATLVPQVAPAGPVSALAAAAMALSPDAPQEYVVKRGDTLWDISRMFLRQPWYWPEIWQVNPQIANPHLIYPGDVLRLVYVDGQPRVTLERAAGTQRGGDSRLSPQVRREALDQAITTIPYDVVASFMGRPTLLDKDQVDNAPYVVAMRDGRLIGAMGNEIYARRIAEAPVETRYAIIHVEEELIDPDTRRPLGYAGVYVGTGAVATEGDPAKLMLTESTREALQGDKLFPETIDVSLDFVPHAPEREVDAAILAVRSQTVMGQYQVVALNRGAAAGLEAGHVLAAYRSGEVVRDGYARGGLAARGARGGSGTKLQLPDERSGFLMVFKAFEQMSYALVMEASHELRQGDRARNP